MKYFEWKPRGLFCGADRGFHSTCQAFPNGEEKVTEPGRRPARENGTNKQNRETPSQKRVIGADFHIALEVLPSISLDHRCSRMKLLGFNAIIVKPLAIFDFGQKMPP
ncbi:MAG: hypothetical protein VXX11_03910 [Planctomycetota bacterium]|nr:hypothetical protein [Planctomycetota bacterium]